MSVCNIAFKDDEVLILTDTLQYDNGKPVRLGGPKCVYDASKRFALVTRGIVGLGEALEHLLLDRAANFDHAEQLIGNAFEKLIAAAECGRPLIRSEATLAGWSTRRNDLAVLRWRIMETPVVEIQTLKRGWHVEPCHPRVKLPQNASNANSDRMVKVALAQQAALNTMHAKGLCIGGRMHLTSISRSGVVQREVGRYLDYETHRALAGDPLDEEGRLVA